MGSGPLETIEVARLALARARERLLEPTPSGLGECRDSLAEAADSLRRLRTERLGQLPANGQTEAGEAIRAVAVELDRELAEVRGLLEQAGAFYLGWAQILLLASGTYGAGGELRAPPHSAITLEG